MTTFLHLFPTCRGWMAAVSSRRGLVELALPQTTRDEALRVLRYGLGDAVQDRTPFGDLPERLQRYLSGEAVSFADRLDISGASAFQQAVWQVARAIPPGRTRSYRWVAEAVGKPGAARAVGQALGSNPLPILIPCHRVIPMNRDGALGGYSGGLEFKRLLLELERKAWKSRIVPAPAPSSHCRPREPARSP